MSQHTQTAKRAVDPAIDCTLSKERRAERREEIRSGIMQRIRRVRELPDGYAFGLDLCAGDEAAARDFVAFERECCGFARYDVARDEAESVLWLSVRGPGGTKDFVKQLAPSGIAIEPAQPGDGGGQERLLRAGFAGIGAAIFAIVCCATPMLAVALGAMGLGAAVASASSWLDAAIAPLLLASLLAIGVATWRRRATRQPS
jgi:mercuric ion transport protein